jgi:Domain of unknown function (DUF5658)
VHYTGEVGERAFDGRGRGHQGYVDGLTWQTVGLTVVVYGCSILDALLTLLYLEDGGSEANPLMHLTLAHSTTLFLTIKIGITGAAAWWLAAHQQWPLATHGLYALALGYGTVLVYHLVLWCV